MRSARMLMATAAAAAVLTLGAPGVAYASGGWDTTDSSSSEEPGKDGHEAPRGDMHTGGGAPTTVTDNGWSKPDSETTKDGEQGTASGTAQQDTGSGTAAKQDENSWSGQQGGESWSGKPEKPSGGVHTGGGGLASPTVTAGGLAVLAVAATGLYAARRKKTAGSAA
ncbi:hypothetical protein [Streptomyces europaeiscabiei]|uniref:hypothetical protein n=1 Tax=Streptomyces europaeiscabiei TaxID=146819 RepID=UPI000765A1B9|nr:hypothetical protein [Streptomyces europaeiscabiei]MDX2771511.1 hypothetical protein [Streptomyces europaeiscabiei]MDX3668049.1 hypothetical protein [Streptomyces europaeiscabiei]MDX3709116.1 hypothetical protein [Streptomyces europaeiscabiei]MDX3831093.1 hypothetical protein [Streptomyces europaeiscabiei]MDX3862732.1 hypothetical protein [Streptomyces europaeiscabiei]